MYVCRTLSFKGADFTIDEVPLELKMQVSDKYSPFVWNLHPRFNEYDSSTTSHSMLTHFVVFQDMYLKACFFWSTLRVELMSALDALQEKKPSQNQLWRLYWANHQVKYMVHCKSDISIKGQ